MDKIALIGDIVASKKISNRGNIQRKLNRVLNKINAGNNSIISPLTVTLGDEFQGLYKNADHIFNNIWNIIENIYPVKIRFSIGIGKISTKINKEKAIGMDGSAFHNARKGLEQLKQNGYLFNISSDSGNLSLIKNNLFLISHIIEPWKMSRIKIFTSIMSEKPINEIAKKIKITDKAVYKNINAAGLDILKRIFINIQNEINETI